MSRHSKRTREPFRRVKKPNVEDLRRVIAQGERMLERLRTRRTQFDTYPTPHSALVEREIKATDKAIADIESRVAGFREQLATLLEKKAETTATTRAARLKRAAEKRRRKAARRIERYRSTPTNEATA